MFPGSLPVDSSSSLSHTQIDCVKQFCCGAPTLPKISSISLKFRSQTMVEQMVKHNLSKYGLGKRASILTSPKKQSPVAAKNSIKEVLNDNKNGLPVTKSATSAGVQDYKKYELPAIKNTLRDVHVEKKSRPGNSASQRGTGSSEAVTQAYQSKRPPGSSNMNNNLVYARRKSDAELTNSRNSNKNQPSQQPSDKRYSFQTEVKIEPKDGIPPVAHIPVGSAATPIGSCENEKSAIVNSSMLEHWDLRFIKLQKYLKQCDSSQQEVYVQKLRSVSRDKCCRHAVELERRAVQLMLEEGRELKRVKELNILGKSAGNSFKPSSPLRKSQKL